MLRTLSKQTKTNSSNVITLMRISQGGVFGRQFSTSSKIFSSAEEVSTFAFFNDSSLTIDFKYLQATKDIKSS